MDTLYLWRMDQSEAIIDNIDQSEASYVPVQGEGCGQKEDEVHCHEQRDWEVKVEAVRGGLDKALAEK